MKYLKLIWLITSGRLTIEKRNPPEKNGQFVPVDNPGYAYRRIEGRARRSAFVGH